MFMLLLFVLDNLYLAPCYVRSGVCNGFTGDDQLSAHLLEVLRPGKHFERWGVLEEGESLCHIYPCITGHTQRKRFSLSLKVESRGVPAE